MKVEIWTDGSATTKDKPGGWAWVLTLSGEFHSEGSGHLEKATNNDAELAGSLKGLEAALNLIAHNHSSFPLEIDVTLKSDSQLILGWASGEYKFKQIDKLPLYDELRLLMRKLKAKTEWVKGHAGHQFNERCDYLANQARLGIQKEKDKEEAIVNGTTLIGRKKDGIVCFWAYGKLKVVDTKNNVCEDYNREVHGKRGSLLEFRGEKLR
jgi:ribonuclease HI